MKVQAKPRYIEATRPICKSCGFLIRGKNHDQGAHHQNGKGGKYNPPRH
jgi:hypothetical protein